MTLEQFRTLFGRAAAPLGATPSDGPRGDHDLNPGFTPRPEVRPAAVLVPVVELRQGSVRHGSDQGLAALEGLAAAAGAAARASSR